MDNNTFKNLIQNGESDTLAFLEMVDFEKTAVLLSSMLNHKGGNLIIGIDSSGKQLGVQKGFNAEDILSYLVHKIIPESPVQLFIEELNGKTFLLLKVWEGTKQPYIFNSNIYYRKGKHTHKATSEEISILIHERRLNELQWERQVSFGIDWDDFDHTLIQKVMNEAQTNERSSYKGADALEFLSHYGLFNNGAFTNACVVLFALNPIKYLPQTRVRLTEYADSKTDKSLIRDALLEGNLFSIRTKLESYVQNMGIRSVFSEQEWKRLDYKYPEKALQEGIINALIHRDYSLYNSHLTIAAYQDSFVVTNSGQLPEGLKVADLKKNHRSFPVNPDIAHITFLMGYIDKLGRGTVKILEECKALGLKEPKWSSKNNEVSLTFYGPKGRSNKQESTSGFNDIVSDTLNDAVSETVSDAVNDAVSDAVKVRLNNILKVLYNHETLTLKDLVSHFNSSRPTIQRDILLLATRELIKKIGSDKYRAYALNDRLRKKFDALNDTNDAVRS